MSWHPNIGDEIRGMFARLSGCVEHGWFAAAILDRQLERAAHVVSLNERERTDPVWRAHVAHRREQRRRARMAADPEFNAKVRQQRRDAKARWLARQALERGR